MRRRRSKHFLGATLTHPEEAPLGGLETGCVVKMGDSVRRRGFQRASLRGSGGGL
jgi:hypothetical protein